MPKNIYKNENDIIEYLGLEDNLKYYHDNKDKLMEAIKEAQRLNASYILTEDYGIYNESNTTILKVVNDITIYKVN